METQAQAQARRAETVAKTMDALSTELETSVTELRHSSEQMHDTLRTVERIADYTRLLSINASIEAARAGEHGKAFAVVVDEVKRLADTSGKSTKVIEERVQEIETSVNRVAAVTLIDSDVAVPDAEARTVAAVNRDVRGMSESASKQLVSAKSVHALGDQINALTEALLVAVGRFRFGAHLRAQGAVEELAPVLIQNFPQRVQLERAIGSFLRTHSYFELGYLTDSSGRQIIDNLELRDGRVVHDAAGLGRDWSDRPWYRAALDQPRAFSTDVYRSAATRDFCFTIAMALRDELGNFVGVFGCDVNFERLVGE